MKPSKALPVGLLVLALTGTGAVIATAQSAPATAKGPDASAKVTPAQFRHGRDGGHHKGHHKGPRGEMFRMVFDAADADGDRTVTQAEIDAYRAEQIGAADASGDGALSIKEFDTLYRSFTRSRMVDAFQDLDADGDGQIAPAELDTRIARFVERLDRDGDGALTLQRPGANKPSDK